MVGFSRFPSINSGGRDTGVEEGFRSARSALLVEGSRGSVQDCQSTASDERGPLQRDASQHEAGEGRCEVFGVGVDGSWRPAFEFQAPAPQQKETTAPLFQNAGANPPAAGGRLINHQDLHHWSPEPRAHSAHSTNRSLTLTAVRTPGEALVVSVGRCPSRSWMRSVFSHAR